MKILITGGAGFIGSQIADRYIQAGHEVVIFDDLSTGKRENLPRSAKFYEISILEPKIAALIGEEKPDILNHHAAQIDVRKSVADPGHDAEINIVGTLNLLEICRRHGVQKVIFASSGGAIYGGQDYFPADEKHPANPVSPYGISKAAIESYLHYYRSTYGLRFVALRYANVYGPRQNDLAEAGVITIFITKLLKGEAPTIYGDGKQTRDYVFVDDVLACNMAALEPNVEGIFNVGTGVETDVNTLATELIRLTGVDLRPLYAAPRPGEQRRSSLKPGALQTLPPTQLAKGLRKTVEWFRGRT